MPVTPILGYHELTPADRIAAVFSLHLSDTDKVLASVDSLESVAALEDGQAWPAMIELARRGSWALRRSGTPVDVEWWQSATAESVGAALRPLFNYRGSRLFGPADEPPRASVHSDGLGRFRVVDYGSRDFVETGDGPKAPDLSASALTLVDAMVCVMQVLARFDQ